MTKRSVLIRRTVAIIVLMVATGVLAAPLFRAPVRTGVSVWPADGATLATSPPAVRLEAALPAQPGEVHVTVLDDAGDVVSRGAPRLEGTTVVQPVDALANGGYRIAYHVELQNTAQITGSAAFGVGTAARAAGWGEKETRELAGAPAGGDHSHGSGALDPLTTVALSANGVVLLGIVVLEVRRRRAR